MLRTAPLAALYCWRAVPLHHHDAVCRYLGELVVRQILSFENEHSGRSTAELDDMIYSMCSETMDEEIDQALRRNLAAIECRATVRLIKGGDNLDDGSAKR